MTSYVNQPCAWCGLAVRGRPDDDTLHLIDAPQLDVRIAHHVLPGDAACCVTEDPMAEILLDEGCSDERALWAIREVMTRGPWAWRNYMRRGA